MWVCMLLAFWCVLKRNCIRWHDTLTALLEHQPEAVVFNGCQDHDNTHANPCVTANPTCWIGSENGLAPDPTWSTGITSNASSSLYCPKTIDTTIQV